MSCNVGYKQATVPELHGLGSVYHIVTRDVLAQSSSAGNYCSHIGGLVITSQEGGKLTWSVDMQLVVYLPYLCLMKGMALYESRTVSWNSVSILVSTWPLASRYSNIW
jgi:hypothetical protein